MILLPEGVLSRKRGRISRFNSASSYAMYELVRKLTVAKGLVQNKAFSIPTIRCTHRLSLPLVLAYALHRDTSVVEYLNHILFPNFTQDSLKRCTVKNLLCGCSVAQCVCPSSLFYTSLKLGWLIARNYP